MLLTIEIEKSLGGWMSRGARVLGNIIFRGFDHVLDMVTSPHFPHRCGGRQMHIELLCRWSILIAIPPSSSLSTRAIPLR